MTSYRFSRWQLRWRNTTSGFIFGDVTVVKGQNISANLELFFWFWLWPYKVIGILFCIGKPNCIQIGQPVAELWCHIHYQDGGRSGRRILLPVSDWLTSLSWEYQSLSANQISSVYLILNAQLRYYYFRFVKTNVRCIGILLLVSFSTINRNWHSARLHPNWLSVAE